jgi:hypothetical protein
VGYSPTYPRALDTYGDFARLQRVAYVKSFGMRSRTLDPEVMGGIGINPHVGFQRVCCCGSHGADFDCLCKTKIVQDGILSSL